MTPPGRTFPVGNAADVVACFDATGADVHGWVCRILGGDRAVADSVLTDVYVAVRRTGGRSPGTDSPGTDSPGSDSPGTDSPGTDSPGTVDDDWLTSTAFRLAAGHDHHTPHRRARAVTELVVVRGRSVEDAAVLLEIDPSTAASDLEATRASTGTDADIAARLRDFDAWLDDGTRRRVRAAIVASGTDPLEHGDGRTETRAVMEVGAHARADDGVDQALRPPPPVFTPGPAAPTGPPSGRRRRTPVRGASSDQRPPRRATIGLSIALVAALTAVVVSLGGTDDPEADTAPSSVGTTTTDPTTDPTTGATTGATDDERSPTESTRGPVPSATTTTRPALTLGPGYLLDAELPGGLQFAGVVENVEDNTAILGPPLGWFDLWAEPAATRTSGRWFGIAISLCQSSSSEISLGAQRIAVGDRTAVVTRQSDGVLELVVDTTVSFGRRLTLLGFGFEPAELATVAAALVRDNIDGATAAGGFCSLDTAEPRPIRYSTDEPPAVGLERRISRSSRFGIPYDELYPASSRISFYLVPGTGDGIALAAQRNAPDRSTLGEFLLRDSPDTAALGIVGRRTSVNGRDVTIGAQVDDDPEDPRPVTHVLRWTDGDETFTLFGSIPLEQLLAVIGSERPASEAEWAELSRTPPFVGTAAADDADDADGTPPSTVPPRPTFRLVGTALSPDGLAWSLLVGVAPDVLRLSTGGTTTLEVPLIIDSAEPVVEFATQDATLVVVVLRDPGAATSIRVSAGGMVVATADLLPTEDPTVVGALAAIGELPPYSVELLDATGAVVRVLPP